MDTSRALTAGYGEFKAGADYGTQTLTGVKTGYASLDGTIGRVGLGMYYNSLSNAKATDQNLKDIWGGYLKSGFGRDWSAIVDYQKVQKEKHKKRKL